MTREHILDLDFVEARHKLIDLGAFLDRVARAAGSNDFRMAAFHAAIAQPFTANPALRQAMEQARTRVSRV